jgi:hypothetical protein
MEALKTVVKQTAASVTQNAKVADLQKDIVDVADHGSRQRTDHGVLIQDADNWSVLC